MESLYIQLSYYAYDWFCGPGFLSLSLTHENESSQF